MKGGDSVSYIARISQHKNEQTEEVTYREQALKQHLQGAESLGKRYGQGVQLEKLTGLTCLLHDLGKYSDAFQQYIRNNVYGTGEQLKRGSVTHAFAGGHFLFRNINDRYVKLDKERTNRVLECMANAIYSHHGNLKNTINPDGQSELANKKLEAVDEYDVIEQRFFEEVYTQDFMQQYIAEAIEEFHAKLDELEALKEITNKDDTEAYTALITKFLFSAVIDADRTDSRCFEEQEQATEATADWGSFEEKLNTYLASLKSENASNKIKALRKKMSDECFQFGQQPTGIYTLSIPTGGGKTLASLRFAFQHAQKQQKKRIIYVVPYTTIIEQNADTVRKFIPKEAVLEHHSNVMDFKNDEEQEDKADALIQQKLKQAKDNWDSPIIFTTMVQFLNTFYNGASRNTRRLHNLAESIVIFDEVQAVPTKCLGMFNKALWFMKNSLHTTSVLCTATQPALDTLKNNVQVDAEMIQQLDSVIEAFKRTNIVPLLKESFNTEKLATFVEQKMTEVTSVLIILNTKKAVKDLYVALKEKGFENGLYHLSTHMCAAQRLEKIKAIRDDLNNKERVICVSTQLIEAGVDVSFDTVIRSLAGLDSIAQAAGRCNRHGEVETGEVFVIEHKEENLTRAAHIKKGGKFARYILRDIEQDATLFEGTGALGQYTMTHYFTQFYSEFAGQTNYPSKKHTGQSLYNLLLTRNSGSAENLDKNLGIVSRASFKDVGEEFCVIDEQTTDILVPYTPKGNSTQQSGADLIAELTSSEWLKDVSGFLKRAQHFTISVHPGVLNELQNNGCVILKKFENTNISPLYVLLDNAYDDEFGLNEEGTSVNLDSYIG